MARDGAQVRGNDVRAEEIGGMNELALFAGAGGGILGGQALGWRTVCAVEWEPYAASILAARQNDGLLPPFPVWDDVRTFDGRPWRGLVDVVSGGFPCQDISVAGKGAGITGERSGLWSHMARIVGEVRPRFAFVENSPALLSRGLGVVLSDLAALGYDCRWTVLGAADVGAPHRRERFWLVATNTERESLRDAAGEDLEPKESERVVAWLHGRDSNVANPDQHARDERREGDTGQEQGRRDADRGAEQPHAVADADRVRELQPQGRQCDQRGWPCDCGSECCDTDGAGLAQRQGQPGHARQELAAIERADWWQSEPDVGRVADGVAARVDRLKAIGNGQVPKCAAEAWRLLTENA
jgi:DNA (cytosine-5)-methyltransferase 1